MRVALVGVERGVVLDVVEDGAGDDVCLDVAARAGGEFGEGGAFEGCGDEGDGCGVVFGVGVGDGEGDAVDGDAPFGDDGGHIVGVDGEGDAVVGGVGLDGGDGCHGVYMALDDVPAHEGGGCGGVFEVDL